MIDFVYWIFLVFSLMANIVLVWYCRELLRQFYNLGDLAKQMNYVLKNYEDHITTVFNKDMFYGDPTMESLVNHSKDVTKDVSSFIKVFDLVGEEINILEENEEEEKER